MEVAMPFNKVVPCVVVSKRVASLLLLTGRGGEVEKRSGGHGEEEPFMAGREGEKERRRDALSSTSADGWLSGGVLA
jgi:hypothetical protein